MATQQYNRTGQVWRCPVCGAEVSVIRAGRGALAPRCCNRPMELLARRHATYCCPICGSEVMVIREGSNAPEPRCCNRAMLRRRLAA